MATKTPNLGLILPGQNEFVNTWGMVLNQNLTLIDASVGNTATVLAAAAGSKADLPTRLAVSMNSDGTLIATPEVAAAESSWVYGNTYPTTWDPAAIGGFLLNDRISQNDWETFRARFGLTELRDSLAWGNADNVHNSVVSAQTSFMGHTAGNVTISTDTDPLIANINGYLQAIRINSTPATVAISGGAGTYYITLTRIPSSPTSLGGNDYYTSGTGAGQTGTYVTTTTLSMLTDTGTGNFVTLGVQPGDLVTINAPGLSPAIGTYLVAATNVQDSVNLLPNQLAIVGNFPAALSGLTYKITNPSIPQLGFSATQPIGAFSINSNKIYIGRCIFDGANVTSVTPYALKGRYAAFSSITLSSGTYSISVPHNLGYFPKKIQLFGSQANDFSAVLEPLSYESVSGATRSAVVSVSDTLINITNPTSGTFYYDFSNTKKTAGYLYVVVER